MIAANPGNLLARFGLANEFAKLGQWAEAIPELEAYLASYDDEGSGWLKLADAYDAVGRSDDAKGAIARGITAALRFGHTGLAAEMEARDY
jgi:predicted Zn-dependent protease